MPEISALRAMSGANLRKRPAAAGCIFAMFFSSARFVATRCRNGDVLQLAVRHHVRGDFFFAIRVLCWGNFSQTKELATEGGLLLALYRISPAYQDFCSSSGLPSLGA